MESRGGVLSLPGDTVRALVLRLETYSTLGRDWRGLAEWIGFKARHVQYVETLRTNNHKTSTVLHAWDKSGRSSVEKLAVALICLGNIDCLNVLKREPTLRDLDFSDLDEKAARIKASYQERLAYFPHFTDSEVVSDDQWTLSSTVRTAPLASGQSPVCWELLGRSSLPAPARSPDEEHPSLSASPSVAAGVSPSRHKVFCSYYPDSSSTHWMKEIAGTLVANGFTVEYANERRMEDPEFKMNAIRSSYNILVLCTPRYCDEFERLSATPSLPSKVKYDRSLIRQIFFDEQERIICVSVDGACCIPQLFQGLRLYRYPSQMRDLVCCARDEPLMIAPKPESRIRLGPIKIAFQDDVKKYRALHGIPDPQGGKPVRLTPQKITPRPLPTSKKSLFKRKR